MKKRIATLSMTVSLLAGSLFFHAPQAQAAEQKSFTINVEDKEISFTTEPFLKNDRLMVPLRSLSEALGAEVTYDGSTRTATIVKGDITLKLDFTTGKAYKNGNLLAMDPGPQLVNDRTMVPIRWISEAFGNPVSWDQNALTVTVAPTQATLQMRQQVEDILTKSNAATNAKQSYQMNMNIDGTMTDGKDNVALQGNILANYTKNPLAFSFDGNIKVLAGLMSQTVPFKAYLKDGVIYFQDPTTGKWNKTTAMSQAEWNQLVGMLNASGSVQQTEQLEKLLPYYKLVASDDKSYKVSASFDKKGYEKLMELSQQPIDAQAEETLKAFKNMTMVMTIDKQTNLQTGLTLTMEMEDPDSISMKITLTADIQKYDQVPAIVIPQEVLDNAVEVQAPAGL